MATRSSQKRVCETCLPASKVRDRRESKALKRTTSNYEQTHSLALHQHSRYQFV